MKHYRYKIIRLCWQSCLNKEYITNSAHVCFQLKWRVGWELELWNFCQQWWTAKKNNWQTTLRTWLKNNSSCSNPNSVMRRHFPLIPFLSQWKIQLSTGLAALLSLSNFSTPPIFFSFTKLYYLANSSASTCIPTLPGVSHILTESLALPYESPNLLKKSA